MKVEVEESPEISEEKFPRRSEWTLLSLSVHKKYRKCLFNCGWLLQKTMFS